MVLRTSTVSFAGKSYRLLREETARRLVDQPRKWNVVSKVQASKRLARRDVRPGEIDREWIIQYDDWSGGSAGLREGLIGTIHLAEGVSGMLPGTLRSTGKLTAASRTTDDGQSTGGALVYGGDTYVATGQIVTRWRNNTSTVDNDFGAGNNVTDMIVHNDEIVFALGNSVNIWVRNAAGTYTQATDAVVASRFAHVESDLWRFKDRNKVSNIGATDNPRTLASWSSDIAVGDDDHGITDLNGYGERLAVSKVNGLYLGDASAIFPNVLSQLESVPDADNGKGTLVRGSDIFYPHRSGLILYSLGSSEEVGLSTAMPSADLLTTATKIGAPGQRPQVLMADGQYVWAVLAPQISSLIDPTGVLVSLDNMGTFTSYLTEATDEDVDTGVNLNSLDPAGSQDWLLIGAGAKFYQMMFDAIGPNINASTWTVQYSTGAGTWAALPAAVAFTDQTRRGTLDTPDSEGGTTMARSGLMIWKNTGLGSWTSATYNGTAAFWIRMSPSAAFDSAVSIGEIQLSSADTAAFVYRLRGSRGTDPRVSSIIWEPYQKINSPRPHSGVVTIDNYPHFQGRQIVIGGRQTTDFISLPDGPMTTGQWDVGTGKVIMSQHDGGMPQINKQWLFIRIKGRTIAVGREVQVEYAIDGGSFTNLGQANTEVTTYTLSGITGRSIQLFLQFSAPTAGSAPTEVNEVEIGFRELPTYKNEYEMVLELGEERSNYDGGVLPIAARQITNLEALRGTTVTMIEPTGRNKSVTVTDGQQIEAHQTGLEYPIILYKLKAVEV